MWFLFSDVSECTVVGARWLEETAEGTVGLFPGQGLSLPFCGGLAVGDEESGLALVQRQEENPQDTV